MSDPYTVRCACSHWWADHNDDDTCALCGCDWFMVEGVSTEPQLYSDQQAADYMEEQYG